MGRAGVLVEEAQGVLEGLVGCQVLDVLIEYHGIGHQDVCFFILVLAINLDVELVVINYCIVYACLIYQVLVFINMHLLLQQRFDCFNFLHLFYLVRSRVIQVIN